ncbi:NAD(P)/FAD-dependent oxidoreductase [Pseudomonas taiwanensis]|uniref:NAD(P)/FAD-dependent oxidoreductase n=1 Tax=Pseudomonas taiwanensis TaxID=470150 RepID=A0ABR6V3B1_9PSED|nr:NAD(P)/FAD-dependent oxidoreductase [Pseudomonas taiwanensis]MBC3474992.1 NAD(P)/FAD-dependent oxidoreductase [Pseudomonas taiwanensis]
MTHRIVIVGGGAGGLELATQLGQHLGRKGRAHITLVDSNLTHIWKPLLHEVAAGSLNSSLDELNYVAQARWNHFHFQYGRMCGVDRTAKTIKLARLTDDQGVEISPERELAYDSLVISVGSQCNDFGTAGVKEHCAFLDSRDQAEKLHKMILSRYLRAHASDQPKPLSIAVVGAGATGVELSAELHHAVRLIKGYGIRQASSDTLKIYLIEAGERILPALPERISQAVHRELIKLGIEVLVRSPVQQVTEAGVVLADDDVLQVDLKIWAAGIKAPAFLRDLDGLATNRINQIEVLPTLQSVSDESIFALGDCAACPIEGSEGKRVPPRAQAAHQQAKHLAKNLALKLAGKPLQKFVYRDYGTLVSLASFSAVGTLMGNLSGTTFVEGLLARMFYLSLYRMHQAALLGKRRVLLKMLGDLFTKQTRPRLRLH